MDVGCWLLSHARPPALTSCRRLSFESRQPLTICLLHRLISRGALANSRGAKKQSDDFVSFSLSISLFPLIARLSAQIRMNMQSAFYQRPQRAEIKCTRPRAECEREKLASSSSYAACGASSLPLLSARSRSARAGWSPRQKAGNKTN
jgi:hypothetical protein